MRLRLILSILIGLPLFLISCIEKENSGYPRTISFEPSGGSKEISGNDSFSYFAIYDGDNVASISFMRNDTIIVVYDWLMVTSKIRSNTISIIAESNSNTTSRELKLFGASGDKYDEILIHQNGLK